MQVQKCLNLIYIHLEVLHNHALIICGKRFEYVLIDGVNDSDEEAEKLATMLRGIPCKINLMALNAEDETTEFKTASKDRILRFQDILRKSGYTVFLRQSRGSDISAACGQLAGKLQEQEKSS